MTCYGCTYFTSSEKCNWFYRNNKGSSRSVPDSVKNIGCKQRKGFEIAGDEIAQYIINKFKGEII